MERICRNFWKSETNFLSIVRVGNKHGASEPIKGFFSSWGFFQLDGHGVLILPEDQTYVWMAPYLEGLANSSNQKSLLCEYIKVAPVPLSLPLERFDWATFIESARNFMGPNFMQFVMLLAGGISAFHYQRLLSIVGK